MIKKIIPMVAVVLLISLLTGCMESTIYTKTGDVTFITEERIDREVGWCWIYNITMDNETITYQEYGDTNPLLNISVRGHCKIRYIVDGWRCGLGHPGLMDIEKLGD